MTFLRIEYMFFTDYPHYGIVSIRDDAFCQELHVARYRAFVTSMKDTGIIKEINNEITRAYTENEYRSEKRYIVREKNHETVVQKVCALLGETHIRNLAHKYRRDKSSLRAFCTYVMSKAGRGRLPAVQGRK